MEVDARWFLSRARFLERLILTESKANPQTSSAYQARTDAESCSKAWLAAREAVACCFGVLNAILQQNVAPSRTDVWCALLQTQAALRLVDTCIANSSNRSTTPLISQDDVSDTYARLRVYSEVGTRCAELLVLSETHSTQLDAVYQTNTAQKLQANAARRVRPLLPRVAIKRRIRKTTSGTWKRCYLKAETARQKLVELVFARVVYQRIQNIKVRDLLLETTQALQVADPKQAVVYLNMANELSGLHPYSEWDRRYPCQSDAQDIIDNAIADLQDSSHVLQPTSIDDQASCMDWIGLSVTDAKRLRAVFNEHVRAQRPVGLPVSWRSSYRTPKISSSAPRTPKDSSFKDTRHLDAACQEVEEGHLKYKTNNSPDTKQLWISERLWASVICAGAFGEACWDSFEDTPSGKKLPPWRYPQEQSETVREAASGTS